LLGKEAVILLTETSSNLTDTSKDSGIYMHQNTVTLGKAQDTRVRRMGLKLRLFICLSSIRGFLFDKETL